MRYVCQSTAVAVLSLLVATEARGQVATGLSINNYQFVSEQRLSRTHSYVTYRADLVNTGPARDAVTATVASLSPAAEVVAGQSNLRFAPVPAGARVTSSNTFTLLVDRSVSFDLVSGLRWTFLTPWAVAGPNQTVKIGDTVTLNGSQSMNPSGAGTLSYHWSFVSRPFGTAAKLAGSDSVIATFVADVPGQYVLQLTVNNGFGSDSASVTVSTTNSPPTARAGANFTVGLGATAMLNGAASFDVDGDPLTYTWTFVSRPAGSTTALVGANTVAPTFVADRAGTYIVQLVVNDGKVNSGPATVEVSTINTQPVANAGPNQTVQIGAVVLLSGAGSTDVDGDPLTYRWSFNSIPAGSKAVLSNPSAINPTFVADVAGTYVVQLIVKDGLKDSEPSTTTVTTNTIQAPVAIAGPNQTVRHGELVLLSGGGTDPQGLPLTFHWSITSKPAGSTAVLSSLTAQRPSFTADIPGQYVVQLIVNNGYLNSPASTLTVTTTNTPPVAVAGTDQVVQVGATVNLSGSASSDADGDPLTYAWSLIARPVGSAAVLTQPATATPSFVADVAGTYVAQLIVNDKFANSQPTTVTITAGVKAIVLSPSPLNIARGSFATLTVALGSAAGPGGVEVKLASSDTAVVSVPATVLVPQSQTSATVTVTAGAAGSALILATATGFSPGSVTANVTVPAITLALDSSTIGVSAKTNATIAVTSAAPAGGLLVSISALPGGVVTVPPTATIPAGGTSVAFQVTGAAVGNATITASIPGYTSGSAAVMVTNLGAIQLASNVSVAPGQSAPFGVSLLTPAPVGGVSVQLVSSAPEIATVPASVTIPQGAIAPDQPVQVRGVAFGTAVITASATGFQGDSESVRVTAALSFTPASLTLGAGGSGNLTLTLSAPAPAGLVVNLKSDNTSVATVPATVAFVSGASSAVVPVTGVSQGNTVIRASALPHLAETSASVTVAVLGSIVLPTGATVGAGQSATFPISLSAPAPAGGTTITLTSSDAGKLTIAPATVTVEAGKTAPSVQPQITGKAPGTANVTASAAAYGTTSTAVSITAALSFSPASITVQAGGTQSISITVPSPLTSSLVVSLSSDNASVVTLPSSMTIPANALGGTVTITGAGVGTTKIRATATGWTPAEASVTVQSAGVINLAAGVTTPLGGTTPFAVSLARAAVAPVTITLTSSDPSKLTISPPTVTIAAGQTTPQSQPQVSGVSVGSANVNASADGYTSATQSVRVTASLSFVPSTIAITGLAKQNVTLKLSAVTPAALTISVGSDSPGVATVPASVTIPANSDSVTVQVSAVSLGTAVLHAGAPPDIPDTTATVTVNSAGKIGLPATASVALGSSTPFAVSLPVPAPADVVVTLSSSDGAKVSVTPAQVTVLAGATTPASQPQVGGVSIGSANITASAPGYTSATSPVNVTATLTFSPSSLTVGRGTSQNITLNLSAATPVPLTIALSSDDAGVASVPSSATIPANSTGVAVPVTGVAMGSTVIRASGPAGVAAASASVTVGSDIVLPAEISVSPGEQTTLPLSLSRPASEVVFIQLSSSDTSKATLQQSVVTIQQGETQPATMPRVNGVAFGTATITASGSGFSSATANVKVGAALSFTSNSITLAPSTTHSLGISLSASAPAGGLLVNLSSSNTGVATLPSSVTIEAGQTGVLVPLNAVAIGTATITASTTVSTVTAATMSVTVATPGVLSIPTTFAVPMGESLAYPVSLSSPAGAAGVTVNLTASSPNISFVPLVCPTTPCAPVPSNATQTSFFIAAGQTQPAVPVQIRGVSPATVSVTASAPGYATVNGAVQVTGSFSFTTPSLTIAPGGTGTLFLALSGAAPPPPTGLMVTLSSSNPGVATVQPSVMAFWDGSSPTTLNIAVTGVAAGSTTIRASAANMADATATVVVSGPVSINTATLPSAIENRSYSTTVSAAGGKPPYRWSATGLPAGLTLDEATGAVSGVPTNAGSHQVSVTVSDSTTPVAQTASKTFALNVAPPLSISTGSLPAGLIGTAYSATLAASNGTAPFTWSASGLPAGLILNTSTGAITGTPTAAGTSAVALTLTDSTPGSPQTATKTLNIVVRDTLAITTTSLPGGVTDSAYSAQFTAVGGTAPYTWSATGLPAGLGLNITSGAITGTPTATGTSSVAVTVRDSSNPQLTASANFSVVVTAGLTIVTPALNAAVASAPYSFTLAAAGGATPYSWSASGLPSGLTINASTGVISGTPAAAGTSSVSVSVTDSTSPNKLTATKSLSLVVRPALTITTATLPSGTVNIAYSATLAASGGTSPYTWSATGLPAGLTLNSTTGAITGTPTAAATNTVVVTVTDSTTPAVTKSANLSISVVGLLTVTTASLPGGISGVAYSATLAATGGRAPYNWSATGLPTGLTLNAATGVISGTPTAAGTATLAITVTDSTTPTHLTASANLAISIAPALSIPTTAMNAGAVGVPYSGSVAASGGTPPYSWSSGPLPAGLNLNASTGAITGTPTAAGSTTVAFTVVDSTTPTPLTVSKSLTIAVAPALAITTSSLAGGAVGVAYSATVSATGGNTPYSWSASGLPAGVTINATSGVISGTPTAAGTSNVTLTVTDSTNPTHASASRSLSIVIVAPPSITTSSLPDGVANLPYTATVAATGGNAPYTWSASGLPQGLSIDAATGVIAGTPTAAGTSNASITVIDSTSPNKLTASRQLSITIGAALTITTTSLPAGSVNAPYSATLAASGGRPGYSWSATGLPAGLTLNAQNGQITGTPTNAATSNVAVTVTDSSTPTHASASKNFSLTIGPPVPASVVATFGSGQSAVVQTQFASQLQVSVKDASNAPVGGVPVVFAAPGTGASLSFATGGTSATVNTNSAGLATSPLMTANATGGSYSVTATVAGLPPATFALTNTISTPGAQITVANVSVGQNLQRTTAVTLSEPAGAGGVQLTIASADPARALVGGNGRASIQVTIPEGQNRLDIMVHALSNTGSVNVTATATGYQTGTGVITLTPSAFVIEGPNGVGPSFQTFVGVSTNLSIASARLDSAGKYVEKQPLRSSLGATATVNLTSTSAGTITPASLVFSPGDQSQPATFKGINTGLATVTAEAPSGFTLPTDGTNTVSVTVLASALIMPTGLTVGRNLQIPAVINLNGSAPSAGLALTVTSNDPTRLLFSSSATAAGTTSITLTLPAGARGTPEFYVQGNASSGTATFTAQAAGFGSATETVTLAPGGLVFTNSFGGVPNPILAAAGGSAVTVSVYSAMLNASGAWVQTQTLAGGRSATATVTSGDPSIGTVNPAQVTINGGEHVVTTQFQPAGNGSTSLSLSVPSTPSGFSTPAPEYRTLPVSVTTSRIVLTADGLLLGKDLQAEGAIILNQAAPSGGLAVTLTSNSSQLRLSAGRTTAGQNSIQITIPAGSTTAAYFVQSLGSSGTASYTATAAGYQPGTASVDLTPSGVVVSDASDLPFLTMPSGTNTAQVLVRMAQLNPADNTFQSVQALRAGLSLNLTLTSANNGIATVDSPVTINGGADPGSVTTTVRRAGTGSTTITVTQPPGFVAATNTLFAFKPMPSLQVTVN